MTADIIDLREQATKIQHSIIMVDAAMATRWLEFNTANRQVRTTRVAKYRQDMLEGRWTFAGDPIRFAANGDLQDGQHRLLALSELPGVTIPMLVIRGLPSEAKSVMDQGAKRTPGDQLGMRGVKNANNIAATVKVFILWERGLLFRDTKVGSATVSTPLIEEWVLAHSVEIEHLQQTFHQIRASDARPSVGGAAFLIFQRIDPEEAAKFFNILATGALPGNPINTLDRKLRRDRKNSVSVTVREELALFIQAWNAWREGREVIKFRRPRGAAWTLDNFPEPR